MLSALLFAHPFLCFLFDGLALRLLSARGLDVPRQRLGCG